MAYSAYFSSPNACQNWVSAGGRRSYTALNASPQADQSQSSRCVAKLTTQFIGSSSSSIAVRKQFATDPQRHRSLGKLGVLASNSADRFEAILANISSIPVDRLMG